MRRRDVLRVGGVLLGASLAGCTLHPPTVADIVLDNRVHARRTVTITVTRSRNGTPVLADTAELKPSGRVLFDDPITDPGEHCVSIAVEGGPSGMHPWDVPRRADPAQLTVVIRSDSISFIEVIA